MTTKKIMAIVAVALMVASSLFVFALADDSKASANDETIKTLDEIAAGTDYWVTVTKDPDTGEYEISNNGAGTIKCTVKVNHNASTSALKIMSDCGVIIDSGSMLIAQQLILSGGNLTVNGKLLASGYRFENNCGSVIKINVNGMILNDGGALRIVDENQTMAIILNTSIEPKNKPYSIEFPVKEKNKDVIDLKMDFKNENFNRISIIANGASVYIGANFNQYSIEGALCTLYLNGNAKCYVDTFDNGNTYITNTDDPIYLYDSSMNGQIIDKNGKVTSCYMCDFSGDSGIEYSDDDVLVECGKTVNLVELFNVKVQNGYTITHWYYKELGVISGEKMTISDPTNFKMDGPVSISVSTEYIQPQKDYTGFFIGAYVLLILAILAPFAVWYIQKKQ